MKKIFFGLFFALSAISAFFPSTAFALSWVNPGVTFGSANWDSVASDADGSNLAAGINGRGYIYISDDSGATWTQKNLPYTGVTAAVKIASDDDGSNLIVGGNSRLFTSDDYGETWTERQPDGDISVPWAVASDSDGSNLIAAYGSEFVFISDDGGVSWTPHNPSAPGLSTFLEVASDSDGSHLMAGTYDGRLYTSGDFGDTWTERQPAGNVNRVWRSLASDADGSNLIAGVESGDNGRLYTSSNGGANWTERQPAGDINVAWAHVASDATGQHLLAGNTTRVYFSDDGGVTWNEQQPDGDANFYWNALASDADGSNLIIAAYSGNLFLYPDTIPPEIDTLSPEDEAVEVLMENQEFSVGFDESVSAGTGNITIHRADDDSVVETFDVTDGGVVVFDASDMYFSSSVTLDLGTEYYILIDAGAVEDLEGNAFAGISDPTVWNFTTDAAPVVSSFTPEDNAVDFSRTNNNYEISITFDQSVIAGTGNITLYKTSDDSVVETFDVTDGDAVTFDGGSIYLFPAVTLDFETEYYFFVDAGAIEDENGNAFAGISDPTTWSFTTKVQPSVILDDTFITGDGFDGDVYSLAIDADGKILVGGNFGSYDSNPAFSIARLNTDGSLDETFVTGDGFNGFVYALALDADGKILVGGDFNTYDGDGANYIARLNTNGTLDDTFVTGDGFNSSVRALALDADGKILVGGDFSTYDSDPAVRIARLNTDGTLDDTFVTGDGFIGNPISLALQSDGKILVGGTFTSYDGDTTNYIARLNTDGTLDDTFVTGDGFDDTVTSLALDADGKILVGGGFSTYDSDPAVRIARLNTDGSLDEAFVTGDGFDDFVRSLVTDSNGKILVGGQFSTYNGDPTVRIARLNTDGSLDEAFVTGDGFDSTVRVMVLDSDTTAVVGGSFTSYDGDSVGYIVRLSLPVEEEPEQPPVQEEEEEPASGGGTSYNRSRTPATDNTNDAAVKAILEQLITLLQQLIAQLVAEQQN